MPTLSNDFDNTLGSCHSINSEVEYKVDVSNSISIVTKDGQKYFLFGQYHKPSSSYQSYSYLYDISDFDNIQNTSQIVDLTDMSLQKYKLPLQQTQGVDIQTIHTPTGNQEYLVVSANNNHSSDNIHYNNKNRLYWYLLSDFVCQNNIDCLVNKKDFKIKPKLQLKGCILQRI